LDLREEDQIKILKVSLTMIEKSYASTFSGRIEVMMVVTNTISSTISLAIDALRSKKLTLKIPEDSHSQCF